MHCDVLVVGAGPAGSSAALTAAWGGAEVILVDKRKIIGHPVQCAEYIPKMLSHEVHIPNSIVAQEVKGMRTFLPDGSHHETRAPGFMIDRQAFDQALVSSAMDNGVTLLLQARCISQKNDTIMIKRNDTNERLRLNPVVTIGADGPLSTVGRWIDSVNTIFIQGLQYELPLVEPMDVTEVHFHNDIYGGYGWVFPKGDHANVGVGLRVRRASPSMHDLGRVLKRFIHRLADAGKVVEKPPESIQAGLIPVGGPLRTQLDTFLLAGDAAGQTDPITGAGIPQAVVCGSIAGKIAARVIRKEDLMHVVKYEPEWRKVYGDMLDRAVRKRQFLESNWDRLGSVIRKCWPAFREYYHNGSDPLGPDMEKLRTTEIYDLMDDAWKVSYERSGPAITFYHPGMINYQGTYGKYQAISITGTECDLQCDHCRSKLLEPMLHAISPEELIGICKRLDRKGEIGCLLTGGSRADGSLPWKDFIPAIRTIKESTRLFLSIHSGIIDSTTARELRAAGIDQALIDVIADDETIRSVFHADYGVRDIEGSLKALASAGLPIVPHILVGLNEWRLSGELRAINMIENLKPGPQAIVVISFMPLPGTPMARTPPPHYLDIARIMAAVRIRMPDTPLFLGCARDRGNVDIDCTALRCGVNGIVLPSDLAIELAKEYELEMKWQRTCCSVPFIPEKD